MLVGAEVGSLAVGAGDGVRPGDGVGAGDAAGDEVGGGLPGVADGRGAAAQPLSPIRNTAATAMVLRIRVR